MDELEHDTHVTTTGHKAAVEAPLTDVLTAAKITSVHDRLREIMLLMEGAMVLMLIGNRDFANAAAKAAKKSKT